MPAAVMGKDVPLAGIFDPTHKRYGEAGEFRALYESDPDAKAVVDTARGLEGLKRQWGVHAAGVILCREPLLDVIPIHRREQDGAIITQFDMGACETLGLLKMDFLGPAQPHRARRLPQAHRGQPRRDRRARGARRDGAGPETYELLARGDTLGVFQLDGGRCARCCARCSPDRFETISRCWRSTGPGRWAPTPTTTTPTARPAASRSCRSTPSWPTRSRTSWATPTG
jgi:DNA polymerase-3 subunit alpha